MYDVQSAPADYLYVGKMSHHRIIDCYKVIKPNRHVIGFHSLHKRGGDCLTHARARQSVRSLLADVIAAILQRLDKQGDDDSSLQPGVGRNVGPNLRRHLAESLGVLFTAADKP